MVLLFILAEHLPTDKASVVSRPEAVATAYLSKFYFIFVLRHPRAAVGVSESNTANNN